MNASTPRWTCLKMMLLTLAAGLWFPLPALAADTSGNWRATYDIVMMWVNFAILLALLFKFLRPPVGRFLQSQKDAIQKTLDQLENKKCRLRDEVQALQESLTARKAKAQNLHQRIIQQAKIERREIIAIAQQEARRRLSKARQLIDNRQREACQAIREQMVDMAVRRAMEELPQRMTPELEQALVQQYITSLSDERP